MKLELTDQCVNCVQRAWLTDSVTLERFCGECYTKVMPARLRERDKRKKSQRRKRKVQKETNE